MVLGALMVSALLVPFQPVRAGNISDIRLPAGFRLSLYATVPGARSLAFGQSTGTVVVGSMRAEVYAIIDKDKDRRGERVEQLLTDGQVPNGVAVHQGLLYVAERTRITRYPAVTLYAETGRELANGEVIFDELPDKRHHGWRYIDFGPDGKLYVAVGSPCNICATKGIEGTIIRMDPDGGNVEVFASGIRHSVGFDFHPQTGVLHFTDNNTDRMGDDIPPGEFNVAQRAGMHFGFPYYAGGSVRHKNWTRNQPALAFSFPEIEFQAHTAPLGVEFYTGAQFPEEYKNDAFVAQHGSWNRSSPVGYRVMRIKFDESGEVTGKEVFADGWLVNGEAWGRPVDILQLPDGSLLLSDDYQGVVYRISYDAG